MAPIVLGIDTSGTWCSAALVQAGGITARRLEVGNSHSDHLLDMIDAVLAEAGVRLDQCTCVAFGAGPGSFTGLRIACSVAQGLAFGAGLQVAPVGTLDAIAHSIAHPIDESAGPRPILVAQDARMGEIYWTVIDGRDVAGSTPVVHLDTPERLRTRLAEDFGPGSLPIGCGNAWAVHGAALDGLVDRVVARVAADAVDVAQLGARAAARGALVGPAQAIPLYVRDRVAQTTAERAARTAALVEAT